MRFARAMAMSVTVHVETSAFDVHKVLHPEVAGTAYQRGALYESNLRGYVLTRDRARCVYCGARPGKGRSEAPVVLQIDHVIPRGLGSDTHWNRVTACAACNNAKGRRTPRQWLEEDAPATVKRRARAVLRYVDDVTGGRVSLSAMAAANVVGPCVAEKLSREGLRVVTCSGADTAAWRKATGVAKSHAGRRDKAWCRYCGAKGVPLQMDPVVAKSRGGADGPWNRMPACAECNAEKGSQDPATWVRTSARVSPHHGPRAVGRARRLAAGKVPLDHMAATNVVAPAIARACEAEGWAVVRTSGADTAAWRRMQGVAKSHANDALCTAAKADRVCHRSMRALQIRMTGRGRRLVRAVNQSGFPRLRKVPTTYNGRRAWAQVPCEWHRKTPPCGLRAGDTVRIHKEGFGHRRRIGVATTVRHDGRCVVQIGRDKPFNIMASRLTLAHRGLGAHIR